LDDKVTFVRYGMLRKLLHYKQKTIDVLLTKPMITGKGKNLAIFSSFYFLLSCLNWWERFHSND
jgi:hypothetical protein